jgi:hypothetical protein
MTTKSSFTGFMANWTLAPPTMFTARMMSLEALTMMSICFSVRLTDGATAMESPVCTPIGSKFSMTQMMMH